MEFIEITREQYYKILEERVSFDYFDGDYWYVTATLDNDDESKNEGLPYKLRICLSVLEGKSLTFFNNDRLKDIINYVSIVDIDIINSTSKTAFTNYDLEGTPEQNWLRSFIGCSVDTINLQLKLKGFETVQCLDDNKWVWVKESINISVIAKIEFMETCVEIVNDVWSYDGIYKEFNQPNQ
jgi:hypothetical protein